MVIISLMVEQFQTGIFGLTGFIFMKGAKQQLKNWLSNSDFKKRELLGKGKDFAYS